MSCTAPIGLEQLIAYWSSDLDAGAEAAVEEHLFACDTCFANAERVQRVVQAFRTGPPPVISQAELDALRAQGLTLGENRFAPGEGKTVTFAPGIDMLIHHLTGLDLTGAERVEVIVRSKSHGVIFRGAARAVRSPARRGADRVSAALRGVPAGYRVRRPRTPAGDNRRDRHV